MNKMAIFVEGLTELEFDTELIREFASSKAVTIESREIIGGSTIPRTSRRIDVKRVGKASDEPTHFFMIYNCGNDALVKDRMIQEYDRLVAAGYTKILCHRDVYPSHTYAQVKTLERLLPWKVPTKPINVTFVLSVMEVEAWFLAEHRHFANIDPSLTTELIAGSLQFDPSKEDMRLRDNPAKDLQDCYGLVGVKYGKGHRPTIDAIDYPCIYLEVAEKFPELLSLCDEIIDFLADTPTPAAAS